MRAMNYIDEFLLKLACRRPIRDAIKCMAEVKRAADRMKHNLLMEAVQERARKSAGGKITGKLLREEAEEMWQPHALELAREIQAERPLAQLDLAEEIPLRWRKSIHCPKSQLVKALSRWQNEGKLARLNK
jgi:hypothetical protein